MPKEKRAVVFGIQAMKSACIGALVLCCACTDTSKTSRIFERLPAKRTGVEFKNEIIENDFYNFLNFSNIYTGSGVGIGDFDKDGLPDIFFGGCMETSRLYLNRGDFKFKDATVAAGLVTDRWVTGVTVIDINSDGWLDLYLSVSGIGPPDKLKNLLFISNGIREGKGQISFTESAEIYGIADASPSTHANFFDFDKDGDLDLFVIVNPPEYELEKVNNIRPKKVRGEAISTDKLYRNNTVENELKRKEGRSDSASTEVLPLFTDISKEAGILIEGYSLGLNVSDLNNDHWPDIYITNDFLSNDIAYINNQDGTFTNRAAALFKHTSYASMGMDVADINNDGLPEVYVLDMLPEENYRRKMIVTSGNYDRFQRAIDNGYEPSYTRNTLQLNNGDGTFSEVGQQFGVHKTGWSWSALLADYDNDGFRDLYITNGFKRDLGNLDYVNYGEWNPFGTVESQRNRRLALINEQPAASLFNYVYQNRKGEGFEKKSKEWGIDERSVSSGAAFADLDLDGDLDLVVNNIGQEAFIYENKVNELSKNRYLKLQLEGNPYNSQALGAKIWLYYGKEMQFAEHTTYRGYQSSVDPILHFGLGNVTLLDSIRVVFPDCKTAVLKNVKTDTLLLIKNRLAREGSAPLKEKREPALFEKAAPRNQVKYVHQEDKQVDFKQQSLLPHQHSQLGPAMAKGDMNGDGYEDVFIGGAAGKPAVLFFQKADGTFIRKEWALDNAYEDTNAVFFDSDADGDLDLYVCSGGVVQHGKSTIYQDRLYQNDGSGNFVRNETALPAMPTSTKAIAAADYDGDGDIDLFVGGRVTPREYPRTPQSCLLENQKGIFRKSTKAATSKLNRIGMITDALWTDFDTDGDKDLILLGEWMPITIFENREGRLAPEPTIIEGSNGWWNTIAAGDFDNDGDLDFLAGNLGLNTDYRASMEEPFRLYAKDFDQNGSIDPILSQYIDGVEQAVAYRDDLINQIPPLKRRFNTYHQYAEKPFKEVFTTAELKDAEVLESYLFTSSYVENLGQGKFEIRPLPMELQIAPIKKFLVEDFDGNGHLDALVIGNDYSTDVTIGRYDAFSGAVLEGDGTGNFKVPRGTTSGFLANKNAQNMIQVQLGKNADNGEYIWVGNNSDSLQVFKKVDGD
ncbi:VCBS repeat-containing protein [Flavobacteriaceae bacterium TP-CH-4]|uniref:VCBS repeat-containing protein n=1 Tax=Pelagihabitans pacificus TaxID=2696054 RepID=A0A967AW18_9FLAO|nr:VCBS repeat-containing protein [Pelagihabitans pacificus]NHF61461.1 VCBS repeat-containing protein [Pelagihabitans pacificus]